MIRRRVRVSGFVQGVWFRESTRQRAESAGVAGWVRNAPDGSVEAVFEGDADAVDRLVDFCRKGPRGAVVETISVEEEPAEGLGGFRVVV